MSTFKFVRYGGAIMDLLCECQIEFCYVSFTSECMRVGTNHTNY